MAVEDENIEKETPEYVIERVVDEANPLNGEFTVERDTEEKAVDTNLSQEESQEQEEKSEQQNEEQSSSEEQESSEQESETQEQESQEQEQQEQPVVEITDEKVLEYIKAKGIDAEDFEALKPKEQKKLAPEVEKFNEFVEKTGNTNMADFLATQKDWSEEPKEVRLKELMRIENPDLDQNEIDFLFKKRYSYDEEYDDEDVVMEKKISEKTDLRKADALLEQRKQEFMVVRGSDENIPQSFKDAKNILDQITKEQEEAKVINQKQVEFFTQKTNELFSKDFEGFKVKVGDTEFTVKPQNIEETKKLQSDVGNLISKYIDTTTGFIKDVEGYHKALYAFSDPDGYAKHFLSLGVAQEAERNEKESKNITPGMKNTPPKNEKVDYVVERA